MNARPQARPTPQPVPASGAAPPTPWWHNAALFALVFSLFLHVGLGLVLALMALDHHSRGDAGQGTQIQLALNAQSELAELPSASLRVDAPASAAALQAKPAFDLRDLSAPASAPDLSSVNAADLSGAGAGAGAGPGAEAVTGGATSGGTAAFFGVEARGSRFAYVVDLSGSMQVDNKIASLQGALGASIDTLLDHSHFIIVGYNADAVPVTGLDWSRADNEHRAQARRAVSAMTGAGGTDPRGAFGIVFDMTPRPDAIYFMSDGAFPDEVERDLPRLLDRLAREGQHIVPIHCITFVDRSGEAFMRRVARLTGGSYNHVPGPKR